MNRCIGDKFPNGEFWKQGMRTTQCFAEMFIFRQQIVDVSDQSFKTNRLSFLLVKMVSDGSRPIFPA